MSTQNKNKSLGLKGKRKIKKQKHINSLKKRKVCKIYILNNNYYIF